MKKLSVLFSLLVFSSSLLAQTVVCKETRSMLRQPRYGVFRISDMAMIGEKLEDQTKCLQAAEIANYAKNNIVCGFYKSGRNEGFYLYRISDSKILSNMMYLSFAECDASIAYSKPNRVCVRHQDTIGKIGYITMNITDIAPADATVYDELTMCYENISTIQ